MTGQLSPGVFWGICAAAIVLGGAVLLAVIRNSDPAARGPIPYKKYDMGAHMEQERRENASRFGTGTPVPPQTPAANGAAH